MAPHRDIGVGVVASGFVQLLLSQLSTRIISFALNLLIARHLSPEAYGLSSVQFHLITTTTLLLSREGLRRGCLRLKPNSGSVEASQVLSVAWLVLPSGVLVCTAVTGITLAVAGTGADDAYRQGVLLHALAAMIELAAEPLYILALVNLRFQLRATIDTVSLLLKSALTLYLVSHSALPPATIFSLAQLAYACAVLVAYAAAVGGEAVAGLRQARRSRSGHALWGPEERGAVWMSAIFSLQAAEKQVLAEGSKFVLAGMQSSYNQGVYGLVANLGSLVVRTLFQPLEEIAFAAFSRFQVSINASKEADALAKKTAAADGGDGDGGGVERMAQVLSLLVRLVCLLGLASTCFGPPYAYTLVRLVYGTKWSETEAPAVLAVYATYILLLAVNGVTEAFVHAVLDARGLSQINALLVAFAVVHVAASAGAVSAAGAVGLVAADAANMALRIVSSLWYIRRQFRSLPSFRLSQLSPRPATLAAFAAAGLAALASQRALVSGARALTQRAFLRAAACHVGVGAALLACLAVVLYRTERVTLRGLRALSDERRQGGGGAKDKDQ
ncbi:hypothetical protein FOA52_015451 [Chlamydomonas sp. UWO 241]|nr:hypothetical protein FOA52_015451 [Chlamydomonas sp. UWO 241]